MSSASNGAMEILRLRYWQHLLNELLKRKQFRIPVHLAFGHEAAAVALDRTLCEHDVICLSHRNAVYNLVRCKSLDGILEHYRLGSRTRTPGLMGSMNLSAHSSIGYTSSILGNNIPVAAGFAMNRKVTGKGGIVFVFTGDGAIEEGSFWETLVFSRSHRLGIVVVVENNNNSMSSTIEQRRSEIDLAKVCAGAGVAYRHAEGAIYADSVEAFSAARESAEAGIPACVELKMETFNQHAGPTPGWPEDPLRIALEDGLLVRNGASDPVFHVQRELGMKRFNELAEQIMRMDSREKYLH